MTAKLLEKHITDTIREWQVKIGYEGGTMKLYYPAESLRRSLSLDETEDLAKALSAFCKNVQPRLGMLAISAVKDRYCVEIPEEGCSYIEREIPVPELLQNLLQVITTPGNTMEQVRNCFSSYAEKMHTTVEENASEEHEMGHVFSFSDPSVDEYCYCVEENELYPRRTAAVPVAAGAAPQHCRAGKRALRPAVHQCAQSPCPDRKGPALPGAGRAGGGAI